jgi:hypothetical protein
MDTVLASRNLLIFTVYFICVTYIFYQAYKSLDTKVTIETDSDYTNDQLTEQDLGDVIELKFKFRDSYKLSDLTKLPISIKNISPESTVHVIWDQSSITDFQQVTGRVIRLTPGMTDIPQSQAVSIIVPGQIIETDLSDDNSVTGPLFKPEKLRKATEKPDPFSLRLFLKITDPVKDERSCPLRCRFIPKKLSLRKALGIAMKPK